MIARPNAENRTIVRRSAGVPVVSRLLPLLALAACSRDYKLNPTETEPLTLTVTSPTYGEFTGSDLIVVTGQVTPSDAFVTVNGEPAVINADGGFTHAVLFPEADRAMVVDVRAVDSDEAQRVLVPCFDGNDPRLTDPGAISGLLTPTGLDALEVPVEGMVDALGWEDQILAILPVVDTDYFDILPDSVTSDGADVDLAPATDAITMTIDLPNITMTSNVVLLDAFEFPVTVSVEQVLFGANATPEVDADGMVSLALSEGQVDISGIGIAFGSVEVPQEILDLLVEPLMDLVSELGAGLADLLLEQLGEIPLGGPFAFETDLMGTTLAARLVDLGTTPDGVGLGITVSTDGPAADTMPELASLSPTTPSGQPYQLGLAVHEGLLNTVLDDTFSSFLDLDLQLDAATSELLGGGIRALPGGDQMPDNDGLCIGLHAQDASVVHFAEGDGSPLAQVWMPDLRVNFDVVQEGSCNTWLDAQMFAVINLSMSGTQVNTSLDLRQAYIVSYGAEGVDEQELSDSLTAVVGGLASIFMSQVSFDLGDLLGALGTTGIPVEPRLVGVEPLGEEGRYGIYLDVF